MVPGVYVVILRCQYFAYIASIFRAHSKAVHALWKSSLVTWKIALFFAEKWVGLGNSQWNVFNWQYGNHIEDIYHDLINLDKDEPTGSSGVDEVEIMDNILQQSGESSGCCCCCCHHWICINYFCRTSYLQIFWGMCPLIEHQVFTYKKVTFWKI